MTNKIAVQHSSGNVFADLGVKNPEEYLAKSELAAQIFRIVQNRRLTTASFLAIRVFSVEGAACKMALVSTSFIAGLEAKSCGRERIKLSLGYDLGYHQGCN